MQWMLAAILICGTSVFVSCTDDNSDNPITPDLNVAEKIIGKWMPVEKNGQLLPSNKKAVYTFVSTTKGYVSVSFGERVDKGYFWREGIDVNVAINGNKITLNGHPDENMPNLTVTEVFDITDINASEFTANYETTMTVDGKVVNNEKMVLRFTKVTEDYFGPIWCLWECTGISGVGTFNDANARLAFYMNGTYTYWRKDTDGEWKSVKTREFQEYFVDGTLLATRWKNAGEDELREWWEISFMSDEEMVWKALRQNEDGTTSEQEVRWKAVELDVLPRIVGKWITSEFKGQPVPTDQKRVYTFLSPTKAYYSFSSDLIPGLADKNIWADHTEFDVDITDTYMALTLQPDEHTKMVEAFYISDINAYELTADHYISILEDGKVMFNSKDYLSFTKVTADYAADILGTWEGRCTSEGSVFDDGQEHRWQYKADGTFVYYVKDGDNWVPSDNTLNEYFVDGTLLCTRWVDKGVENREWWEITIADGKMYWTALRQNADGTTFTATFEMKKVE